MAEKPAQDRPDRAQAFQDPRSTPFELREAAVELLFGGEYRDADTRLDSLTRVTPDQAREALAGALRTALLVVPCGTKPDVRQQDGTPLPKYSCGTDRQLPATGRMFRPPLLARLFSSNARRIRLVVDESGLWMHQPGSTVCHVRYDEVVGVEADGESRVVFGRNSCFIPLVSDLFPDDGLTHRHNRSGDRVRCQTPPRLASPAGRRPPQAAGRASRW
ncbi:hypothetical protein [Kitasatospora sp. NPDC059800]|uniref:hypothetical protein n=1 Tax=Kitasatospora sp. NPDC059800 TaxID=3346951 RepID=UPI003661CF8C